MKSVLCWFERMEWETEYRISEGVEQGHSYLVKTPARMWATNRVLAAVADRVQGVGERVMAAVNYE